MNFEAKIQNPDFDIVDSPPDNKNLVSWQFWENGKLYQFVMNLVEQGIYFEFKPSEGKTRVNLLEEDWEKIK